MKYSTQTKGYKMLEWAICFLGALLMAIFAPIQDIFALALSLGPFDQLQESSQIAVSAMAISFFSVLFHSIYKIYSIYKKK